MDQLMTIFVSGPTGNSVVFGVLAGDRFRGADLNGSTLDGTLHRDAAGVVLDLDVTVPSGIVAVQGVEAPPDGLRYSIHETLPLDYADRDYVRLDTPYGPVNARFQVLRTVDPIAA